MTLTERLEIARKFTVILAPLAVAVWTVVTYLEARKTEFNQSLEAKRTELRRSAEETQKELTALQWKAQRPFLKRQMELCFEAVETASTLATATDPAKWEMARTRFWGLYWGELALVENQAVAQKMVEFGKKLENESMDDLPINELTVPSLQIAYQCRALIGESWKVELPELAEQGQSN